MNVKYISFLVLLFFSYITYNLNAVKTVYIPRSQGHAPSMTCLPAYEHTLIATINYAHSYKGENIARDLFGSSVLNFSGSQVPNRASTDVLADNFGLAPDFQGKISFDPKIENIIYALYYNKPLDMVLPGLYVNFMFPVVSSRWSLNPCEHVLHRGTPIFQNGYMGNTLVTFTHATPITPIQNPCDPVTPAPSPADPAPTAPNARTYFEGNLITGDLRRPLSYNKISWCPLKRTELAEIIIRLGRNLICSDDTFLSTFIRASFPTGNKQQPEYLFSPVVGNGKFFELGLGTQGQHRLTGVDNPTHITFLWDASCEHLFQTTQLRTFDLCRQGPLSRYLLLKKIHKTTHAYDNELIEASYATTFPVRVSRAVQGDLDLKLSVEHKGFTQNFGYAMWGTTAESICPQFNQPTCPTNGKIYGIKGTSGAYNYITTGTLALTLEPLNATEHVSTILKAGPIDNPQPLADTATYDNVNGTTVINPAEVAFASNPPVNIGCGDIDQNSARSPAQLTYAFFTETCYTWCTHHTTPSILLGASIETASNNPAQLHQWSLWIKGSLLW